jgi:5'-nucleotidase
MEKPLVLLSNDDGVRAAGLAAFREALRAWARVVVIAPETEQSAASHALSLHRPLRLRQLEADVFALDGTPADCVYVALHSGDKVLSRKPDLVVSGVNQGLNLGQDVFYSGTVAAAREGALFGIPALAASASTRQDYATAGLLASRVAAEIWQQRLAAPQLFSLNIPTEWNQKVQSARLGRRDYEAMVDYRRDPRGREYLWLGGPAVNHRDEPEADTHWFDQGYATLTTLNLDLTGAAALPLAASVASRLR